MKIKFQIFFLLMIAITTAFANNPITVVNNCTVSGGPGLDIAIQNFSLSCVYATWPKWIAYNNSALIPTTDACMTYTMTGVGAVYTVNAGATVKIVNGPLNQYCVCGSGCN